MTYSRATLVGSPTFTHVVFPLQDFYSFRLLNKLILCVLYISFIPFLCRNPRQRSTETVAIDRCHIHARCLTKRNSHVYARC